MITDLKPILITGVYRSGTTLVSRIINNHNRIDVTYDNVHFMRFCYDQFNPITDHENLRLLLQDVKKRVDYRMEIDCDINHIFKKIVEKGKITYTNVYNEVMKNVILSSPANRWGEKTMLVWTKIPAFLSMFPLGKVIHVIRDTRDVLSSFKKVTCEPGLRYLDAIFTTIHSMRYGIKYKEELSSENYYCLKYEDVVQDPRHEIERLCNFLEVPYQNSMLDTSSFTDRAGNSWKGNSAYSESLSIVSRSSVGKFRKELTVQEIFLTEMIARQDLCAFGYELTGSMPTRKQWAEIYNIISDEFINKRFRHWLSHNEGVEEYPSAPPRSVRAVDK